MRLKSFAALAALVYLLLWLTVLPPMGELRRALGGAAGQAQQEQAQLDPALDISLEDLQGKQAVSPERRVRLEGGEFAPEEGPDARQEGRARGDKSSAGNRPRNPREPGAPEAQGTTQGTPALGVALLVLTAVDETGEPQLRGKVHIRCASPDKRLARLCEQWFTREGVKGNEAGLGTEEGAFLGKDGDLTVRVPAGIPLTILCEDRRGRLHAQLELPAIEPNTQQVEQLVLIPGSPAAAPSEEPEVGLALLHLELTGAEDEPLERARVRMPPESQSRKARAAIAQWMELERTKGSASRLLGEQGVSSKDGSVDLVLPSEVPLVLLAFEGTRRTATLTLEGLESGERRDETLVLMNEAEASRAEKEQQLSEQVEDRRTRVLGWLDIAVLDERTSESLPAARLFLSVAGGDQSEPGADEATRTRSLDELRAGVNAWLTKARAGGAEEAAFGESGVELGELGTLELGLPPKLAFLLRCELDGRDPVELAIPQLSSGERVPISIVLPDPSHARWAGSLFAGDPPLVLPGARFHVGEQELGLSDPEGNFLFYFDEALPAQVTIEHMICAPLTISPAEAPARIELPFAEGMDEAKIERARQALAAAEKTRERRQRREEHLQEQAPEGQAAERSEPEPSASREQPKKKRAAQDGKLDADALRALGVIKDDRPPKGPR